MTALQNVTELFAIVGVALGLVWREITIQKERDDDPR